MVGLGRGRWDRFGGEETYGVLFLHREFEINGAAGCIGYSKLLKVDQLLSRGRFD